MNQPLRVLVVHADLHSRLFECSEMWQYLTAIDSQAPVGGLELLATDCRSLYRVRFPDGRGEPTEPAALLGGLRGTFDVVVVFGTMPWYQLVVAAAARLRGARVVLFPLVLLTSDFTRRSWYLRRGPVFRRLKPHLVRTLGWLWKRLATVICAASAEEVRQSGFPMEKVVYVPWPHPDTPLAALAERADDTPRPATGEPGPVAVVSRLDPWRKGFDRIAAWLEAYAGTLPRPSVLLLAPHDDLDDPIVDRVRALVDDGLVEWDAETTGAALGERLRTCRGVLLLPRWDGQPRALREALLLGVPVLTAPSTHLSELLEVVGGGTVVDGDDPHAIQAGFDSLPSCRVSVAAARAAFSEQVLGAFLLGVLRAAATGRPPAQTSYYEHLRARDGVR